MTVELHERAPLNSKKFVAFLLCEISWKIIVLAVVYLCRDGLGLWTPVLFTVVLVAGFIEAAYIGGQAVLDKYVRVAQVAASGASKLAPGNPPPGPSALKPPVDDLMEEGTEFDPMEEGIEFDPLSDDENPPFEG